MASLTNRSDSNLAAGGSGARRRRWIELALLFGVAPAALSRLPRWMVLPGILASGGLCLTLLLIDPTFRREQLLGASAARRGLGRMLARTAVLCAALLLIAAVTRPAALFYLPRARPGVWLIMMLGYPLLSAYPQEVMFRTFFVHRYAEIFIRPWTRIAASAALFGWAHIIVHNFIAMLLATVGGLLFASTYERARSTLLVAVEHALYGQFLLTVGFGGLFVFGARFLGAALGH